MGWRTYLVMYFTGEEKITEIVKKVEAIGFKSSLGPADFIYEWDERQPSKEEVLSLGDKLCVSLKGTGAVFNIETHN